MAESNMPDYGTIQAAVAGEKWAIGKVLDCYSCKLDKLATVVKKRTDGSVKTEIDEDMWQALALKLIEAIPQFLLEEIEREAYSNGNKKS